MHASCLNSSERLVRFKGQFVFRPDLSMHVGTERECFLVNGDRTIVAKAASAVAHVQKKAWHKSHRGIFVSAHECVGYELSASQLETRTPPHPIDKTEDYLRHIDINLRNNLNELGLRPLYCGIAPESMPLDIYPDPTGRYQEIVTHMPRDVLLAACRITGTHGHIGMPDHETALRVYNAAVIQCKTLIDMGNLSKGERLKLYSVVKPDFMPRPYDSWDDFCNDAYENGFADDPRSNWRLIRLTKHGTIEFRMFDSTERVDSICSWMRLCHSICKHAMH